MVKIIPRRGYLMLYTGFILGILSFALMSIYYQSWRGREGISAQMPENLSIVFLYSSEKQGWIEEVIPLFERYFKEKYKVNLRVELIPAGTHETINLILHGTIKPTVWSPASSIWIPYLNKKWVEKHGGNKIATQWVPLVFSPVVIAGWEELVSKYNVTCFKDLYRLAKEGVEFSWGHPDPLLSNGGTMVVLLEFCEATGKRPEELTVDDILNKSIKEFVRTIESRAVRYGKSTGFFGAWAADSGPETISFFGVYENIVIDYSLKARKKWGQRLVAVYPSFGTLLSDHPFVIMNADWVNAWQRFAALELLNFLLQPEIQERAQAHGFRPANPSVALSEDVFNENNGVTYEVKVPIFKPPKGEVLETMLTVWTEVMRKA